MKHYWINIDRCTDRKEFMERQFTDNNIVHQRISAQTPDRIEGYSIIRHPDSKEKPSEICCILSHLKALQQGYDDGEEYFCVTEDDVNIPKLNFEKILAYVKEAEARDNTVIEMLQLYTSGHPYIINMFQNYACNNQFVIRREQCCPATVYYMATRAGAKKLLDKFKIADDKYDLSYSGWTAADNVLYRPINTYILSYPITTTNIDYGSIIHQEHIGNHESANQLIKKIHGFKNLLHRFLQ
jgi:GR25 family glycosyltransferase involved in LPS biosynthesis